MSAQHFPHVETGAIEILCGTGLEVCCALGEWVSARSRHGEGRLKEPGVFSLAKRQLSSDTVCAKYTRGEGCWRRKELVKPRGQCLHKSNWECTGHKTNAVCRGKKGKLSWPAEEGGSRTASQNQLQGHKVLSLVFCEQALITRFSCKDVIGVYSLACPPLFCKSMHPLQVHWIMAHTKV